MDNKSVFNATVCVIGIALLLIHTINFLVKKEKRKDEKLLLVFIVFTMLHFITYLTFTLIKTTYTSDEFIMGFYTTFYIMNNVPLLLLFMYASTYLSLNKKVIRVLSYTVLSILVVYIILDILNIFTHMFFYAENGMYMRSKFMIISQGYQFLTLALILALTVTDKKIELSAKIAFVVYCVIPFIAIIIQNYFAGYAVAYLSVIITVEILFLFLNVRKNIELANQERRNREAEVTIMMSQIKPHFIYNTLASISTLIKIDPDKAQKGLDEFTEYLRVNLSSLSDTRLISFSDELKHIETYLSLEKMRFDERLNVIYDIKVKEFLVPPLSIQPLVENAVKHGILQKVEGGNIIIRSYENEEAYIVVIEDDGVGFDTSKTLDKNHIGLDNVKYRIYTMIRGEVKINSEINKGTVVTVVFYK